MAGHGGGAWKVAYADFVTAMMAFFMVMWITAQNKPVRESIARYFEDPSGTSDQPGNAASGSEMDHGGGAHRRGARAKGRGASEPGPRPLMQADPNGMVVRRPSLFVIHDGDRSSTGTVVPFVGDSAELDATATERLTDAMPLFLGKPNKIEIRGHATRRPPLKESPFADAWQLSYARCMATMRFLEDHGIEPERIRLSQAGPFEPQTLRFEREFQQHNARVEVYMLGEFVDQLQGTSDERAMHYGAPVADYAPADRGEPADSGAHEAPAQGAVDSHGEPASAAAHAEHEAPAASGDSEAHAAPTAHGNSAAESGGAHH